MNSFLNSVYPQTSNDTWPGWRGFEKEGRNEFSDAPKNWSHNKNILWKTAIKGKGHSSPVISGKNLIITTAYQTTKNKFYNNLISYLIICLIIFILFLYIIFIYRTLSIKNIFKIQQIFAIWAFSISLGFIIYFSLTGTLFKIQDNADHITQATRWFFSGMIVSVCFMLATFTINNTIKNRITLIIILFLFSVLLLFLRPAPEYYTLSSDSLLFNKIINSGIIPVSMLVIIIVSMFQKNQQTFKQEIFIQHKSQISNKILLLISIITSFLLGLTGIWIYRFIRFSIPCGNFSLPVLDIYYRDSNVFTGIVFVCLAAWATFYIMNSGLPTGKVFHDYFYKSRMFTYGIIGLAFLIFIKKNYFTIESEFVREVICVDTDSGKIKWTKKLFKGFQANIHHDNSPATPTPIIIKNKIFAYFGTPGLVCTDTSGNIIWQNTKLPFDDIHGIGASPVYCNGLIIILNDMPKEPYITAIDSKTGKSLWLKKRKPWEGFHGLHRTPAIKKINGKESIITWGFYSLNAYDAFTGKELWNYPLNHSTGQLVASIISKGDTLFAPDRDKFYALSVSKLIQGKDPKIWITDMKYKGPVCSSPVFYNDMIFMISDNGFTNCLDAITGKILWREKLNGIFMSSVTLIGENVYFCNLSGVTTVVAADKNFRKISENHLPEPIYASPAPVNNKIFLRTTGHLYCIKEK